MDILGLHDRRFSLGSVPRRRHSTTLCLGSYTKRSRSSSRARVRRSRFAMSLAEGLGAEQWHIESKEVFDVLAAQMLQARLPEDSSRTATWWWLTPMGARRMRDDCIWPRPALHARLAQGASGLRQDANHSRRWSRSLLQGAAHSGSLRVALATRDEGRGTAVHGWSGVNLKATGPGVSGSYGVSCMAGHEQWLAAGTD